MSWHARPKKRGYNIKVLTAAFRRPGVFSRRNGVETGCTVCLNPEPYTHEQDEKDEDGAGLFHARVLLAEAEPKSAKRTKEMLEEAGYMVTVEGDGKQVLESQKPLS